MSLPSIVVPAISLLSIVLPVMSLPSIVLPVKVFSLLLFQSKSKPSPIALPVTNHPSVTTMYYCY